MPGSSLEEGFGADPARRVAEFLKAKGLSGKISRETAERRGRAGLFVQLSSGGWFDLAMEGHFAGRPDFICLLPEEKAFLGPNWEEELARVVRSKEQGAA